MANYSFSPSPTFGVSEFPFVTWQNGFSQEEISSVIDLCESFPKESASIQNQGKESLDQDYRETEISWIPQNQDSIWLYDRLAWIARQLNGEFYKFDLYGFAEDFQYSTYRSENKSHYNWHLDTGMMRGYPPRKLSLVLQLSDPKDYEGGDLELYTSNNIQKIDKELGLVSIFPSYTLHRVTPVTDGVRKTLVTWICGPAFK